MKLNLSLILTSQKILAFLLSILFNAFQLKGDEQFKECLDKEQTKPAGANLTGMYDAINSFGSKQPDKTYFCCDILLRCKVMSSPTECPDFSPPRIFTQCDSINNSKFCISYGASPLPGGICGGILGNANSIIDTVGICPSPDTIKNTLNSQQTIPDKLSWLCCNNENCNVPANVEIQDPTSISPTQAAITNCASGEYVLMCLKDKVWMCTGSAGSTNYSIWPNPIGSCLVQVSLNSSKPLPPSSSTTLLSSLPTTSPSPTITLSHVNDENNRKDVLIGVLSGVLSGVVVIIIGFLVYKWRRWRRREILRVP